VEREPFTCILGDIVEYKIITPVATEPLTLAEVKQHLRITSETFAGDVETNQSIVPGSHNIATAYSLKGSSVDVLGKITIVNLNAGTCGSGGSITAKIQEADVDEEAYYEDVDDGDFDVITEANDNAVQEHEYIGGKQYIRIVVTVAGAACSFSADVITKTGQTDEDTFLSALITTAREYCENRISRALATQTIDAYLDKFPCRDYIELPRPPLQGVTSVKYIDSDGDETTLTENTDYIVDDLSNVGRIVLPYSGIWPTATLYPVNPIRIRFITGYYSSDPIPKSIKQAMLLLIGHWHENREAVMTGAINMTKVIEFAVDALLAMYKTRWF
jgi:uncharacterized phiE125 gp8 family phage protein